MYRSMLAGAILAAAVTAMSAAGANAQQFTADLRGVNEIGSIPTTVTVPTTPATHHLHRGGIVQRHRYGNACSE